jgi:hypothetical protein
MSVISYHLEHETFKSFVGLFGLGMSSFEDLDIFAFIWQVSCNVFGKIS